MKLMPVVSFRHTVQAKHGTARSRLRECIWITGYVEEFFEERDTVRHLAWKFAEDRRALFDRELYQNHLLLLPPACKHAPANFKRECQSGRSEQKRLSQRSGPICPLD
jgi:hypothetical protein